MCYNEMAKRITANVFDFDMHNLIPDRKPFENMEDAANGVYEIMPQKTLRENQYGTMPLMIMPKYTGDFLKKLENPIQGKPVNSESSENLLDFSMPSEMLKHQEEPCPRDLVDEFYDFNRPGDQAGYDILQEYADRSWDSEEAPEISEDKRTKPYFKMTHNIIASFLLDNCPIDTQLNFSNIKIAKLLSDFEKSLIETKKGLRKPNIAGVTVRLSKAEPKLGRWFFSTTSGRDHYATIFQFMPYKNIKDTNQLHVRVSCSCPSWLFWGAQYNAVMGDYLYGKIRPKFSPPKVRDPKGNFLVCKHVLACIPLISRYKLYISIPEEMKKKLLKSPKFEIERNVPEEEIKIPKELLSIGKKSKIKDIVENWDDSPRKRRNWILGLDNPKEVIYFAHKFPDSATALVAERLKQLSKRSETKKEAIKYLDQLEGIKEKAPQLPINLKSYDTNNVFQDSISNWLKKSKNKKKDFISSQTDPDIIAYMAYKFDTDDNTVSNSIEKLNSIIKDPDQMNQNKMKAKKWLREIL